MPMTDNRELERKADVLSINETPPELGLALIVGNAHYLYFWTTGFTCTGMYNRDM